VGDFSSSPDDALAAARAWMDAQDDKLTLTLDVYDCRHAAVALAAVLVGGGGEGRAAAADALGRAAAGARET
jgi:hypothetical protein